MKYFQVCKRLFDYFFILVFLIFWCEVILVRGGYPHFLRVVTRDQLLWPVYCDVSLRTPSSLPFTTEDILITFFCGEEMFYFLNFIPFVLQVELRCSPLWDFHDW